MRRPTTPDRARRRNSGARLLLLPLLCLLLSGCYYPQLIRGQVQLLMAREPIPEVIARAQTDPQLKTRLQAVQRARRWAVTALHLPDNRSYTHYVALPRPYVVWNVLATPEFSVAAKPQCFLIVGCLSYQGFFTLEAAQKRADTLRVQGLDVDVSGVPAYSTLGWFADPVLSSMLHWDDATLISTVFHELAHQVLYIRHDTAFNESFARFVEQQGLREYLASGAQITPPDPIRRARHQQFVALVLSARDELAALYARAMPVEAMRAQKAHIFEALRARYQTLRDSAWQGDPRYDAWFEKLKTNNARLLPFGLYDALVPAFAALFDEVQGDWPRFYAASQALSELPADQRQARIEGLMQRQAKKPAQQALAGD